MPCGHPLAARQVVIYEREPHVSGLRTRCWACAVKVELVGQIVGPAALASRARARDNGTAEYSGPIAHNAQRPPVRLYSEREGVGYSGVQTE